VPSLPRPPLAQIAVAVRTPIGRFLGALSRHTAVELGVVAARAAFERAGVAPREIDLCFLGNARPAGVGPNPARQVAIRAGVPATVPATTINMACGSGLQAVLSGIQAIALGRARRVLVGGFESMSNVPYLLLQARRGYRLGHAPLVDGMMQDGFFCPLAGQIMGETAETLAREYAISRAAQDAFALESQRRAGRALARGEFADESVAVAADPARPGLDQDEHPRPHTRLEQLAALPAVFEKGGTVTAGNSSGLTDAASVLILEPPGSRSDPLAEIVDYEVAGVDPARMGIGPVPATRALLDRCRLGLSDVDLVEINEAFAAQVLACAHDLGLDLERTNVLGGAIALGHPIGATGARITTTLAHLLRRRGGGLGLATLCVSGGMGISVLLHGRPR
jgi:acetyl-CoA C-acetyltransferase